MAGRAGKSGGRRSDRNQGDWHSLQHLPRGGEAASLDRRARQPCRPPRSSIGKAKASASCLGPGRGRARPLSAGGQFAPQRSGQGADGPTRRPPGGPDGDDRVPAGRGAGVALARYRRAHRDRTRFERAGDRRPDEDRRRARHPNHEAVALRSGCFARGLRRPLRGLCLLDSGQSSLVRDRLAQLSLAPFCPCAGAGRAEWGEWRASLADPEEVRESVTGLTSTRPYDLGRHTHSALMLASGMSLQRLARIQGHSIRVLDQTYSEQLAEFEERGDRIDPTAEIERARTLVFGGQSQFCG